MDCRFFYKSVSEKGRLQELETKCPKCKTIMELDSQIDNTPFKTILRELQGPTRYINHYTCKQCGYKTITKNWNP